MNITPTEARLGPYRLVRPLGTGGMAVAYLCERQSIGGFRKQFVAKLIRPEHAGDRDFVLMFLDEARMSATLSHPNVVQVFDVDMADGNPYIIMEYVDGPSFARLLGRSEEVQYGAVALVLAGVARGLHHAHFGDGPGGPGAPVRMIHRDVSLQNILVGTDGTVKLIDFGIAKAEGRLQETRHELKGKLGYLPPEQLRGEPVDYRGDVFSLGVCLYKATTGRYPYAGETVTLRMARMLADQLTRPSDVVVGYPPELERIVLRALASDPAERFGTAAEMATELERFCAPGSSWEADPSTLGAWVKRVFPGGLEDWVGRETASSFGRSPRPQPRVSAAWMNSALVLVAMSASATMVIASAALLVALVLLAMPAPPLPASPPPIAAQPPPVPIVVANRPPDAPPAAPLAAPLAAPPEVPRPVAPIRSAPAPAESAPEPSAAAVDLPAEPALPAPPQDDEEPALVELPSDELDRTAGSPPAESPQEVALDDGPPAVDRAVGDALPAEYAIRSVGQVKSVMSAVEEHAVRAGVPASVARGVTGPLTASLVDGYTPGTPIRVFPRPVFDRIVDDWVAGMSSDAIAAELKKAQSTGAFR